METKNEKNPEAIEVLNKQSLSEPENLVNDYDIEGYLDKRKEFITKLGSKMVEGKDYHVIQGKKSLAKGGAEKIASIFSWTAIFQKDQEISDAFKEIPGLVAFVCNLTKGQQTIGQGRGAASLAKNGGDPNKTIKMAQKSAFIDAVLRTSALSDLYSQDLEDMPKDQVQTTHAKTIDEYTGEKPVSRSGSGATAKQKSFISSLAEQKGVKDKITGKMVDELTMLKAKEWIDKLLKMPDKGDDQFVIEIEKSDLPQ